MIAREKWQIKTIAVMEKVFEERIRQVERYGHNADLEDGIGPDETWLQPLSFATASQAEKEFRRDYEGFVKPTWMLLVREEISEAFELSGDDPNFVEEILQVAALCVAWVEKKVDARGNILLEEDLV
jgi:hypothetical protein